MACREPSRPAAARLLGVWPARTASSRILTALGDSEPQLEVHVDVSLNVGLTPEQIIEVLLRSSIYSGIPRALNAVGVARKVFAERGLLPLY